MIAYKNRPQNYNIFSTPPNYSENFFHLLQYLKEIVQKNKPQHLFKRWDPAFPSKEAIHPSQLHSTLSSTFYVLGQSYII